MARVIVLHREYGCDTGCCGHVVELDGKESEFQFAHPYEDDPLEFAKELVRSTFGEQHVADLDWENCHIIDD